MKKTQKVKIIAAVILAVVLTGAGVAYYMFNMPHRDVQATETDYSISAQDIVSEYLTDVDAANAKYLQDDGESKILAVNGKIFSKSVDQNNQQVILLKNDTAGAGVSCTFTNETNSHAMKLKVGETVTIKGVIRSGAGFDEDLDLYENVIMEKCDVIN